MDDDKFSELWNTIKSLRDVQPVNKDEKITKAVKLIEEEVEDNHKALLALSTIGSHITDNKHYGDDQWMKECTNHPELSELLNKMIVTGEENDKTLVKGNEKNLIFSRDSIAPSEVQEE